MDVLQPTMRVLLIYPRFPKTFWSFGRAVELMGHRVLLPPLGLITVAALLPQSWYFQLVDSNVREVSEAEWEWADLAILSAMIVQKKDLPHQIGLAKQHKCQVAVGGPFATSTPEAEELKAADFLALDEGEITLPMLVDAIDNGATTGQFRAEGEKPDLCTSPIPRFDLLERNAYAMMAVQFSRGCPFQCEFCDIIVLYGRKLRTQTPDQLICELEALNKLNWKGEVFLVDDNFIGNKRNVKQLLSELVLWQTRHAHPFSFTTEASIDLASDEDLMDQMVESGFNGFFLVSKHRIRQALAARASTKILEHPSSKPWMPSLAKGYLLWPVLSLASTVNALEPVNELLILSTKAVSLLPCLESFRPYRKLPSGID